MLNEKCAVGMYKSSDSMASLTVTRNVTKQSNLSLKLKKLNSLTKMRALELLRIPGHNGNRSNNIADNLAKPGA